MVHKSVSEKAKEVREGVMEYELLRSRTIQTLDGEEKPGNLWLLDNLKEILWLRPVFPDPLREIDHWTTPWGKRKVIAEARARQRAVTYARSQLGEPFKLSMFKSTKLSASKWDEKEWYCSLLIFNPRSGNPGGLPPSSAIKALDSKITWK